MKLELVIPNSFCTTLEFKINNIEADKDDFGEQYDRNPEDAEPYGCGNMRFTATMPTEEILAKYNITLAEYAIVAKQLEEGLSFGNCGWCI